MKPQETDIHPSGQLNPAQQVGAKAVTEEDIARHAYFLYLARGAQHGQDVEDWLTAERELRAGGSAEIRHQSSTAAGAA